MSNTLHLDISLALGSYALTARADIPLTGITALEGASGSGKTTLLRAIAGLERRVTGTIRFGARDWLSDGVFVPPQQRRIGYVFQDTRLFDHLDVAQNLAYGHKRANAAPEVLKKVVDALDLPGMMSRRVGALSGGEKQRVAIGRALAMDPELLLMDEPMSGLDQIRKDEILSYIARAVDTMGCPAIYVSHERRETAMLADHIMQVADGHATEPVRCGTVMQGEIRDTGDGNLPTVFIGGCETRLPVCGDVGSRCQVRVDEAGIILCASDPGVSTALANLPSVVVSVSEVTPDTLLLVLEGAVWRLKILRPKSECRALDLRAGLALWISITDARTYPG